MKVIAIEGKEVSMNLKYIYHSSFLLELDDRYILFDYYKKDIPKINETKKLYVFCSHAHGDHFNDDIFGLLEGKNPTYVFSNDIVFNPELTDDKCVFVGKNKVIKVDDMLIETLESTDEGVAFIINVEDKVVYHAGDLNWWTWVGFESENEYENMTSRFKNEIEKIKGRSFDIAMLPLDYRQGERFDWGMEYFLKNTNTKVAVPMHCWEKFHVIDDFREKHPDLLANTKLIYTNKIKEGIDIA